MKHREKSYVTLEQARKLFDNGDNPEKVTQAIKERHISNVENATTLQQLNNLMKNHVRLINSSEEYNSQKWRHKLIERIQERITEITA